MPHRSRGLARARLGTRRDRAQNPSEVLRPDLSLSLELARHEGRLFHEDAEGNTTPIVFRVPLPALLEIVQTQPTDRGPHLGFGLFIQMLRRLHLEPHQLELEPVIPDQERIQDEAPAKDFLYADQRTQKRSTSLSAFRSRPSTRSISPGWGVSWRRSASACVIASSASTDLGSFSSKIDEVSHEFASPRSAQGDSCSWTLPSRRSSSSDASRSGSNWASVEARTRGEWVAAMSCTTTSDLPVSASITSSKAGMMRRCH